MLRGCAPMAPTVMLHLANASGAVTILRPRTDVLLVVTEGQLTSELWEPQGSSYLEVFRCNERIYVYRDASRVRALTTGYRHLQQQFAKDHKAQLAEVVFHQRSALVALAINAGAIFSRANVSAVSRTEFDRRLCLLVGPASFASVMAASGHSVFPAHATPSERINTPRS